MNKLIGKIFNWKSATFASLAAAAVAFSSVAVASPSCPTTTPVESLWSATDVPTVLSANDVNRVDLGVRFQSAVAGQVLGIKFYKGAGNTGTHTGYVWSDTGAQLASVTFTNETASGWQEALFSTPVDISANTAYIVSYIAPKGHYSYSQSYFASAAHNVGDLTAPKDSSTAHNGVYTYTANAFPSSGYRSTNYWVDVDFSAVPSSPTPSSTSVSSSPSPSSTVSPSPSESASASPSSSPSVSSSPSASPSGTPTGPNTGYVMPGSVGYLGSTSALTVYEPGGAAPVDCSWQSYGLRCDDADVTWDHVWIKGSVYWNGTGTITVTNSIIQGGTGTAWYALLGHNTNVAMVVKDSTVGWLPGQTMPGGVDAGPVWSLQGGTIDVERCDISGMSQGLDPGANSVVKDNWIHDLYQNGTASSPTHLDGIYSQGGGNILIQGNYVDVPVRGDTTAAIFIQDRGSTDTGISIQNNYLNGGAYVLRNQTGLNVDVENNTFGTGVYGLIGDLSGYPGTYGIWTGNVDLNGNTVSKP